MNCIVHADGKELNTTKRFSHHINRQVLSLSLVSDEQLEAQGSNVTCSKSQSQEVVRARRTLPTVLFLSSRPSLLVCTSMPCLAYFEILFFLYNLSHLLILVDNFNHW